ncbi:MAG: DNA-deoxyinosine glycosylase [Clostridia bacterium]|nr:DNA-deoxyinosine glycosylase [Clostridia bacterium]
MRVIHPFEPIYNKDSKILILGSFPSVKSREDNFYYAHPQNRFWKVLERIYGEAKLENKEAKIQFLLKNNIAIWDSIKSCDIENSDDSSIKNAIPNDIEKILSESSITKIFCNGNASYRVFKKYYKNSLGIEVDVLPSTSPANARYNLDKLVEIWKEKINRK